MLIASFTQHMLAFLEGARSERLDKPQVYFRHIDQELLCAPEDLEPGGIFGPRRKLNHAPYAVLRTYPEENKVEFIIQHPLLQDRLTYEVGKYGSSLRLAREPSGNAAENVLQFPPHVNFAPELVKPLNALCSFIEKPQWKIRPTQEPAEYLAEVLPTLKLHEVVDGAHALQLHGPKSILQVDKKTYALGIRAYSHGAPPPVELPAEHWESCSSLLEPYFDQLGQGAAFDACNPSTQTRFKLPSVEAIGFSPAAPAAPLIPAL